MEKTSNTSYGPLLSHAGKCVLSVAVSIPMELTQTDKKKILIVEDQAANRKLLQRLLSRRGCEVLLATDGEEGLEVARREKPALIITDLLMPRMDGYEFVHQLRGDPATAQIKVIYYTGNYAASEAHSLAAACGVSHVMDKSAEPAEILRIIDEVMGTAESPSGDFSQGEFEQQHLRLITDKLSQKVDELERLNGELEERVDRRTAELAAANARLVELNRMKDEFLAIVSHDLRSPLSGIVMGAEAMIAQDASISSARRVEFLRQIASCASEQIAFVNDLLALAKNEEGSAKLYLSTLRLSEVAADALRSITMNAEAKGITLDLLAFEPEALIEGDRQRILQLLGNVLSNGVKFTPIGGRICVEVTSLERRVCLKVSDTGVGIPADQLPEVFDRFNPRCETGTAGETGTGLGLAIARQVAELHQATISIESTVGVGTIVTVYFPSAS